MNIKSQSLFLLFIGGLLAFSPSHKDAVLKDVQPLRKLKQEAFKKGEFLRFEVSYGYFAAAKATLEISESSQQINGRNTMHIVGKGASSGALSWFFRVEDRYESFIDEEQFYHGSLFVTFVKETMHWTERFPFSSIKTKRPYHKTAK